MNWKQHLNAHAREALSRIAERNGLSNEQTDALCDAGAAFLVMVKARVPMRLFDTFAAQCVCRQCEGKGKRGKNGGLGQCVTCGGIGTAMPVVLIPRDGIPRAANGTEPPAESGR